MFGVIASRKLCRKASAPLVISALPNMTRILVVDDVERWRNEVRCQLSSHADLLVVGEADTGASAIEAAARLKPDLVLLDIGLPDLNGVQVAHRIRELAPGTNIIFVTLIEDAESANKLVNDGANGYLLKSNLQTELLFAVRQVNAGNRFLSEQLRV